MRYRTLLIAASLMAPVRGQEPSPKPAGIVLQSASLTTASRAVVKFDLGTL